MISKQVSVLCVAVAGAAVAGGASMASCAQNPPNVTVRTFQQAQKVDFVCLEVDDPNNIVPLPQNECAPVPAGVAPVPAGRSGTIVANHLYAVVTQTTPGTLGVVDLTAGSIVDEDRSTPGINFLPVGANPTDVAVTPDGKFTYVSSADPSKPAIYQIDNSRLLGDSPGGNSTPLHLTDLNACALPQPPQALAIVPMRTQDDSGAVQGPYLPTVLLRGIAGGVTSSAPAAVATIDPTSMAKGSLQRCVVLGTTALSKDLPPPSTSQPVWSDGVPYADAGDLRPTEPSPGPQCPWPLADGGGGEASGEVGAGTGDGSVAEAGENDGGQRGPPPQSAHPTSIALRSDVPLLYVADDAVPVIHVIDLQDPTNPQELEPLLATSVADPSRRVAVGAIAVSPPTHDYNTYLYAIDATDGTLMVYDITDPASSPHVPLRRPHAELNPFAPIDRLAFSAPVAAVSFVQHDWPIPQMGSTSPIHQYSGLLCNPNPNANPDPNTFVDRGAYYRADYAAIVQSMLTAGGTVQGFPSRLRGIFGFVTLSNGSLVTIDVDDWDAPCRRPDPMDDGQSNPGKTGMTGVLSLPEPAAAGPDDLDPYHAPLTYAVDGGAGAVTLEAFFPVSAPHRMRSAFLLRKDPTGGAHVPDVVNAPQLFNASGAPMMTTGSVGVQSPLLLPTPLPPGFYYPPYIENPTEPNPSQRMFSLPLLDGGLGTPDYFPGDATRGAPRVRISYDDPTAHRDQDWTVTYEGALPGFNPAPNGITADVDSTVLPHDDPAAYQTLTLKAPGARFCARGVEDWDIGQARASQLLAALGDLGLAQQDDAGLPKLPALPPALPPAQMGDAGTTPPLAQPNLQQWTSDYVEITDDLLPQTDPYWSEPSVVNDCWDDTLKDNVDAGQVDPTTAMNRYNACYDRFGPASDADKHLWRDLPIVHARDDSLEVGRFAWYDTMTDPMGNVTQVPEQTTNRVIVGADPSNVPFLRITRCCFHHQATFKVRAGGEWLAVGTNVGLLHHVKADASGACILSCDPHNALVNARSFDIPWWTDSSCMARTGSDGSVIVPTFDRNSPPAMRNPMMSYVVWSGCGPPNGYGDHTLTTRDMVWRFSTTGSFSPQTLTLTSATTGTAVSPQSMRFISSLGQLAVIDGEAQGLVLIDLNLVAAVRNFY